MALIATCERHSPDGGNQQSLTGRPSTARTAAEFQGRKGNAVPFQLAHGQGRGGLIFLRLRTAWEIRALLAVEPFRFPDCFAFV